MSSPNLANVKSRDKSSLLTMMTKDKAGENKSPSIKNWSFTGGVIKMI